MIEKSLVCAPAYLHTVASEHVDQKDTNLSCCVPSLFYRFPACVAGGAQIASGGSGAHFFELFFLMFDIVQKAPGYPYRIATKAT
jgi:hypothetical protein